MRRGRMAWGCWSGIHRIDRLPVIFQAQAADLPRFLLPGVADALPDLLLALMAGVGGEGFQIAGANSFLAWASITDGECRKAKSSTIRHLISDLFASRHSRALLPCRECSQRRWTSSASCLCRCSESHFCASTFGTDLTGDSPITAGAVLIACKGQKARSPLQGSALPVVPRHALEYARA